MSPKVAGAILILVLAWTPASAAQQPPGSAAPMDVLVDLAETLGQAHAVRSVCNGDGDQTWRNYMLSFLAVEAPSGQRRAALTSAFNRGYRSQSNRTKTCTADMAQIEAQIAARGRVLAESLVNDYLR